VVKSRYILTARSYSRRRSRSLYLKGGNVWNSPVCLARVVVTTSDDSEESVLAPVGSPTVAADPVVDSVLGSPAVELDGVVGGVGVASVVHVDSASVGLNAVSVDVSRDWTTGVDLRHDIFIAFHTAVLADGDLWVLGDFIASSSVGIAVHASVNSRALHVLGLVLLAGNVRDTSIAVDPGICGIGIAAVAGSGISAVNHDLDGRDDISLGAVGHDLNAVSN